MSQILPVKAPASWSLPLVCSYFSLCICLLLLALVLQDDPVKVTQSCPILCNIMDYRVHGILQARILEWVAIPFSRGSSQPKDRTEVSLTAGRFLTNWAKREPFSRGFSWPRNRTWVHLHCRWTLPAELPGNPKMIQAHLQFSLPQPWNKPFSKKWPLVLFRKKVLKYCGIVLGLGYSCQSGYPASRSSQWTEPENICIHM